MENQGNTPVNKPNKFRKKEKQLLYIAVFFCILAVAFSFWLKSNFTIGYKVLSGGQWLFSVYEKEDYVNGAKAFVNKCFADNEDETKALVPSEVQYKKALILKNDIRDKNGITENLADYNKDKLKYACGLYIDGKFFGAVSCKNVIDEALNKIIESKVSEVLGESGEVMEKIITVDGYYRNCCIIEDDKLCCYLNNDDIYGYRKKMEAYQKKSNLPESDVIKYLNPDNDCFVNVLVKSTDIYEDSVPYEIEYTYVDDKYDDYYVVDSAGVNGIGKYTDEVYYLNGEEYKRENVGVEVLQQPVSELVTQGSVERPTGYEPGVASGIFAWPVPDLWVITSYWGDGRNHQALDIAGMVSMGKPIYAADAGVVSLASWGWTGGYGNAVYIDHGNGSSTRYAHCSALTVTTGQVVAKGDLIGYVGNTGASEGPHLHFEILIDGVRVDPYPYLMGGLSIDRM